jgi:ATP-dependent helicase HepA
MLSDEVGLGKTIEACLILHRLLLSGRADRILVLVPESLVHQWFVEMLRRFNVWLHIFDEERCASIEAGEPGANPFLDDQLVLTGIGFLAADPRRSAQAVAAGWDVLGWMRRITSNGRNRPPAALTRLWMNSAASRRGCCC